MRTLVAVCCLLLAVNSVNGQIPKWKITDLEQYVQSSNDDILIINFWATFCKPCIAEIPGFIEVAKRYRSDSVKLLLVSLDMPSQYPAKVEAFVKKYKFKTNHAWLDETDADYFCPKVDPAWSGSIPATLIINTGTGKRKFFEEEMTKEELESQLKEVMKL